MVSKGGKNGREITLPLKCVCHSLAKINIDWVAQCVS